MRFPRRVAAAQLVLTSPASLSMRLSMLEVEALSSSSELEMLNAHCSGSQALLSEELFPQSDEHLSDFNDVGGERLVFRARNETAIERALYVMLELSRRPYPRGHTMSEVFVRRSSAAFGDRRRDRFRGARHLVRQPAVVSLDPASYWVDAQLQRMRLLPHEQ